MPDVILYSNGDANIRNTDVNERFGSETYIPLGRTSGSQVDRVLIGFNFSSLKNNIIDSAVLHLYQDYSSYCYADTLSFHARCITGTWNESTVTYATKPAVSVDAEALLSLAGNANGVRNFNITALVKDIVENNRTCYGIMLVQSDEGQTERRKQFFSEEYDGGTRRPYIEVSYHVPLRIAPAKGNIDKYILSMKMAPIKGNTFNNVIGMKIAPEKGGINKTVF